ARSCSRDRGRRVPRRPARWRPCARRCGCAIEPPAAVPRSGPVMTEFPEFESSLDAYPVKLGSFEGPLDLLIHLIKKNEVHIYDIPIALITEQYLEYLGLMQELNLDVAGEFLVMAATLIHIKSRMLIPRPTPEVEGE